MTKQKTMEEIDWDFYDYTVRLEKEWQKSLPKFSDKELLEIFPEAKEVIPIKIAEWKEFLKQISDTIREKLEFVNTKMSDDFCRKFWREWAKIKYGPEIVKAQIHIKRLERLQALSEGRKIKGTFSEDEIKKAASVPIGLLTDHELRKSGKSFIGLCPLHNEKTPSFHIYPDQNRFWCYGCNQGGDAITFTRLLHGYSFKEAVQYLLSK